MGILESIYQGWFGKRTVLPDSQDDKSYVVPEANDAAGAHSDTPSSNYKVDAEPRQDMWRRLDNFRSADPTTHDAPQYHDQKEVDNTLVVNHYRSAPGQQSENRLVAPDSRWSGGTSVRANRSPSTWRVLNPFDQGFKRRFDGGHFSLADHKRTFPIAGMAPAVPRRNTYRVDPVPHDINIVDMPRQGRLPVRDTRLVSAENPPPSTNSYRLG